MTGFFGCRKRRKIVIDEITKSISHGASRIDAKPHTILVTVKVGRSENDLHEKQQAWYREGERESKT